MYGGLFDAISNMCKLLHRKKELCNARGTWSGSLGKKWNGFSGQRLRRQEQQRLREAAAGAAQNGGGKQLPHESGAINRIGGQLIRSGNRLIFGIPERFWLGGNPIFQRNDPPILPRNHFL